MQYRKLGKTGYNVSAVSYGGIVSAFFYDNVNYPQFQQSDSDRYVAWAIEQGVNYFDVAPSYGDAQLRLGESLIPYRKNVYLAVKTGCRDYKGAEAEMRRSLELLHTDCFDTYQMHALSTMEDLEKAFAPDGCMKLFDEMKQKGIARRIGFTAHSEKVALEALKRYDFDSVLFPFNWHMNMEHGMGSTLAKTCLEKNVGLLCMKSMIERAWDDSRDVEARKKYPKSWCKPIDVEADPELLLAAMKYALSLGVNTLVPPGNFDHFRFAVEHIDEAIAHPLTSDDLALLKARLADVRYAPFFPV